MAHPLVSGELASVRIHIDLLPNGASDDRRFDESIFFFHERAPRVREVLESELRKGLGPGVTVDPLIVRSGSVEILAVLAAVALAIKSYAEFVENVDKAVELTRRHVSQLTGDLPNTYSYQDARVSATWVPGPALGPIPFS
jgi:hypothetical protein